MPGHEKILTLEVELQKNCAKLEARRKSFLEEGA